MGIAGIEYRRQESISWRVRLAQAVARARSDVSFALIDALLIVISYLAALALRFVDVRGIPVNWLRAFAVAMPFVLAIHLVSNLAYGAYGHVWEFASIEEAKRLVFATATASILIVSGVVILREVSDGASALPLTVIVAGSLIALGGMGGLRFRSRLFSFKRIGETPEPVRTLIVGTGRPAAELARHGSSRDLPRIVVGFVSVGLTTGKRRLAGLEVLGVLHDIGAVVTEHHIDEVIVAAPLSETELRRLVDGCMHIEVRLRIVPDVHEALGLGAQLRDIRDLELDDLLPRPPIAADLTGAGRMLAGKRVLVTGAGGSIGSEMVRQLLGLSAHVGALDHDETHLHDAMLSWPAGPAVEPLLCDIRDEDDVLRTVCGFEPDVIFHAAALKHVPILERHPHQAVKTNVLGTANLLHATRLCGASHFVLISTDKAVNPENVLGGSKRIAEMLVQSAAALDPYTKYAAVRFGNVLGSRGSVVPTFMEQIRRGGPVTLTDPEMTRYFMTVGEAIGLVLQASALAEQGEVFVLDMGEPARIDELAHRMIRLAGLVPGRDIQVVITGPRAGERTSEYLSVEPLEPSRHPKIRVARPPHPAPETMEGLLHALKEKTENGDPDHLRTLIHEIAWQKWQHSKVVDLTELEGIPSWI